MDPELAKQIQEAPFYKEFVAYLAQEAIQLNTLADVQITGKKPIVIALEVAGRKLAYEKVMHILEPLLTKATSPIVKSTGNDYTVEVPK